MSILIKSSYHVSFFLGIKLYRNMKFTVTVLLPVFKGLKREKKMSFTK